MFRIGRHSHPKARPEHVETPPAASGIDYLRLVGDAHDTQLGERVNYHALASEPPDDLDAVAEPPDPKDAP